jgi:Holliday junction resolvase RusA-like endonuclease
MAVTLPMQPIDTTDAPFAVPPVIVLDLPVPPSINETHRPRPGGAKVLAAWKANADKFVMAQRRQQPRKIAGSFEICIVFSEERTSIDLDNTLKTLIDYLRRIDAIHDDGKSFMRDLYVTWGDAPEGCRVHIRGLA